MSETLLILEGVGKLYLRGQTQRRLVLEDISFAVAPGEIVAVDAERREGKTTLLRIAAGMETPDTGSVRFLDSNLTNLSVQARAGLLGSEIGWSDRHGPRTPWRVIDYVSLPLMVGCGRVAKQRAHEAGLAALERVGASRCATQQWVELADYEQLLVSLARLYAQRPRLIVVDDLFDDLRVRGSVEAGDLLRSIVRELDCGVLASVSDTEAALLADRVLALRRGRLVVRSDQSSRGEGQLISLPARRSAGTSQ
jgi:ABC-type cobalamin/Fe3+-siderophores transport system ATPase subunit